MKKILFIGLLIGGAVWAQVEDQGWRYMVPPASVEAQNDGAVQVCYDLSEVPLKTSINSVVWYKATASGIGSNPSFAVWAVDEKGTKTDRLSEVTLKPNTDRLIPFPVTQYVQEHLEDGTVTFLIEPRAVPGVSLAVKFSGQPSLAVVTAQAPAYDLTELLAPVWKGNRMVNETLLPTSYDGKPAVANLAFVPSRVICVKNYALDKTYKEGIDYTFDGRTIRLTEGSSIQFFNYKELYHNNPYAKPRAMKTIGGGYLTFSEGAFFNDKQLAVTYDHDESWAGPVPQPARNLLPKTFQTLEKGAPLKLVIFGDSISTGSSASGQCVRAPFMPRWADLVANQLRDSYDSTIEYINPSLGGMRSSWGRDVMDGLVSFEKPDLVVLGFGMNDNGHTSVERFAENTQAMMESLRKKNPEVEFILLMSFQPNCKWRSLEPMENYLKALREMEGLGVAVADVWSMHGYLLQNKTYWDMTGNNVNHPNDFMVRVYAQTVLATMGVE